MTRWGRVVCSSLLWGAVGVAVPTYSTADLYDTHRIQQFTSAQGKVVAVPFPLYRFGHSATQTIVFVVQSKVHMPILHHLLDEFHRDPALSQNKTIYCFQTDDMASLKTVLSTHQSGLLKVILIQPEGSHIQYNVAGHDTAELMAKLSKSSVRATAWTDSWEQAVGSHALIRVGLEAAPAHAWNRYKEALMSALRLTGSTMVPINEYGLRVVTSMALYQQLVAQDPHKELVNLAAFIPDLRLDLKYATPDNFMKRRLYTLPRAYLRRSAAEVLKTIAQELRHLHLGLKIFDAYRPYAVTKTMWQAIQDDTYVADPRHGSKHNRASAVDLTLVNLRTGKELPMPSAYGDLTPRAYHSYAKASSEALNNRSILKSTMEKHGFLPYESEWWHYNFKDWEKHEILDIAFEWLEP